MGIFGGEGRLIGGRYRLSARLGRGGMGTVWRATDELLGRQVAVKELHVDEDADEEPAGPGPRVQRERAMREARTVAGIKHPNVIVVHDVVEQDGRPWIVMELVEGPSLDHRLRSGGPVAPREAARIGIALLGALRAAHTRGVLHRDLKPANVLLESGTGRVVLTDFGIAQVPGVPTLTDTGGFVGSPEYTAPERMSGRGTGPEADLWSLGVLLCAALSGTSPFHRDSLGGVLHAVVYEDIAFPEAARALHAVVAGLLERDPERRLGIAETERLLRGYLRSGRAPERGHQRGPAAAAEAGEEEVAVAGAPGGPAGPRPGAGPHHPPRRPALDAHDSPHDGPGDDLPSEHPPSETPPSEPPPGDPSPGDPPPTGLPRAAELPPGEPPPGESPSGDRLSGETPSPKAPLASDTPPRPSTEPAPLAAAPTRSAGGGQAGRAGGRAPGLPIPAALDDRALAAAVRPHTGRLRTAVLVALAALVIGGAGAGVALLLTHRDGADDGTGGPSPRASGTGTAQRPAPGSARPTVTVTSPPAPGATATLPAGYRLVRDPVGFALAVPDGFSRSYENDRVYFASRGRRIRIGVQVQRRLPEGPLGAMRTADAQGPAHYRGYRRGRVTETTHHGLRAGRWEFVWDGGAADGGPRYTDDLSWDEGGRTIDVWISCPVGARAGAARHLDTALDAFRLTGA
ncbi:protein kinase domain-containing protein [Streptomyces angustmyceticus]|uniref:serine/threonine-protein kinase n=1 Tax=Streptomyces angustmyceticus TaxID=285578 RepID=UPI003D9215F9